MPAGSVLQGLLDASAGAEVHVPYGTTYTLTESLMIDSGMKLRVDGVIERAWNSPTGNYQYAMIRNRSFDANDRLTSFQLYGVGQIVNREYSGLVISLLGDNMIFNGIRVQNWDAQGFMIAGDDMIIRNVTVSGGLDEVGTAGLRILGGDNIRVLDSRSECGDDVWQITPAAAELGVTPFGSLSASNVRFRRCTGSSALGRFMIVWYENTAGAPVEDPPLPTPSISDVRFYRCVGTASNRGIVVDVREADPDLRPPGMIRPTIDDVQFIECEVTMDEPPYRLQTDNILVQRATNILFDRLTMAANATLWYRVLNGATATFTDCTFTGGTDPNA